MIANITRIIFIDTTLNGAAHGQQAFSWRKAIHEIVCFDFSLGSTYFFILELPINFSYIFGNFYIILSIYIYCFKFADYINIRVASYSASVFF